MAVSASTGSLERILRRDRWLVGVCLAAICGLSWAYLMAGAGTGMSTVAMSTWQFPPPIYDSSANPQWDTSYWLLMAAMWWFMMIAMMLPSATPMILLYARVYRHAQGQGKAAGPGVPVGAFLLGYLLAWLAFSVLATLAQWGLERLGWLHGMMMWSTNATLSGLLLLAAGAYQLSPLKRSCLLLCRSPVEFLSSHWRTGSQGALRMGWSHGLFCVGCCWVLMVLLFSGGVMNLVWIVGLAVVVLIEKLASAGEAFARAIGFALIACGLWVLLAV